MQFIETSWMNEDEKTVSVPEEKDSAEAFESCDWNEFAKETFKARFAEMQEEMEANEVTYNSLPDKDSFGAQYFKAWMEFKKDEFALEVKSMQSWMETA